MAPSLAKIHATVLLGLLAQLSETSDVRGPGEPTPVLTPSVATETFSEELQGHPGDEDRTARVAHIKDAFRPVYASVEKSSDGTVSHEVARYLLHRFFINEHGWDLKGLSIKESSSAALKRHRLLVGSYSTLKDNEWLVPHLFGVLLEREQQLGEKGASLDELAAVAETVEDLAAADFSQRLEGVLRLYKLPLEGRVEQQKARQVLRAFLMQFLMAGHTTATDSVGAAAELKDYEENYDGWKEVAEWVSSLDKQYMKADENGLVDISGAKRVAVEIGAQYLTFNEPQCKDMKRTLMSMEGTMPGRVRLSSFYNKSLTSHWDLTESSEYLRVLGSLDESDPQQAHVIIPNYVMSPSNCLQASVFYEICCRSACEDLLGHLERHIGAPEAEPMRIAALVEALPSETVQAPRTLSQQLLGRLAQVAVAHGGKVPLHGRLFAQWMHHAYPRDCPYPHESGSVAQTPDEWLQTRGQKEASASAEQMQAQIEGDTCAFSPQGPSACGGRTELPWSDTEELLVPRIPAVRQLADAVNTEPAGEAPAPGIVAAFHVLALLGFVGLLALVERQGQQALWKCRAFLAVLTGVIFGLLSVGFLVCGLVGALLLWATQVGSAKLALRQARKAHAKAKGAEFTDLDSKHCV